VSDLKFYFYGIIQVYIDIFGQIHPSIDPEILRISAIDPTDLHFQDPELLLVETSSSDI
jgi:hypothetical protein